MSEHERNIICAIEKRTARQVRNLRVETREDRVVIRGIVSSFYVKQLVLQGILDAVGPTAQFCIDLKVDVVPNQFPSDSPSH
jgi:hypothetical protein